MQVQFAFGRLRVGRTRHKTMSGFMSVNLKKNVLYLKTPKVLLKTNKSFIKIRTQNDFLFCYTVSCFKTRRDNVCLFVVVVSCCCRCCRNLPQNEETREKMADHIWHHDNACQKAYIVSYIQKSKVDLPFVFLDAISTPCHQQMKILT